MEVGRGIWPFVLKFQIVEITQRLNNVQKMETYINSFIPSPSKKYPKLVTHIIIFINLCGCKNIILCKIIFLQISYHFKKAIKLFIIYITTKTKIKVVHNNVSKLRELGQILIWQNVLLILTFELHQRVLRKRRIINMKVTFYDL